jgi:hypothetical protein
LRREQRRQHERKRFGNDGYFVHNYGDCDPIERKSTADDRYFERELAVLLRGRGHVSQVWQRCRSRKPGNPTLRPKGTTCRALARTTTESRSTSAKPWVISHTHLKEIRLGTPVDNTRRFSVLDASGAKAPKFFALRCRG